MQKPITVNSKEISILKPYTAANYGSKTVLTDSCWAYVELWLRRQAGENPKKALFYWQQAKHFFQASECLPENAKPLTAYYCCLNATKTLLSLNGINTEKIHHGIYNNMRNIKSNQNSLSNVNITFKGCGEKNKISGVLNGLSKLLGEPTDKITYNLKDILYNIPCIHRTYCITYKNSSELFIPIYNPIFVRDDKNKKAWFEFMLSPQYSNERIIKLLPNGYKRSPYKDDGKSYCIRKENSRIKWDIHLEHDKRLEDLSKYHGKIRKNLYYIYSDKKLWYIKKNLKNNSHIINRSSMTLIYAVMHWLSELVRYNPEKFEKYMNSKQNWLIHEFLEKALQQFIDEISCEITKEEIMTTGFRKN